MSNSFSPGDRIAFKGRSGTTYRGTIRYIGPLTGKGDGEFLGVELRAPHGTSDGRGKSICFPFNLYHIFIHYINKYIFYISKSK